MTFAGANKIAFEQMQAQSPPMIPTAARIYYNEGTYPGPPPTKWPDDSTTFDGSAARCLVSIRPEPALINDGTYDEALIKFMQSAPPGHTSLLTLWHESSSPPVTGGYPIWPTPYRQALSHVQALAHDPQYNINVKVGVVQVSGITAADAATWMPRNMDFYGADCYDWDNGTKSLFEEMDQFKSIADGLMDSGSAVINFPECNSHWTFVTNATAPGSTRRADWFNYAWSWLQRRSMFGNASGLLTFWGDSNSKQGGPWDSGDTPVIAELNRIFAASSP